MESIKLNRNFLALPESYLFSHVAAKVAEFRKSHPGEKVISLGIGDVTTPLAPAIIRAMHTAVDDMSQSATFRGYGPEQGYMFLRQAIAENDYEARGINITPDEIFISDGAKSDLGNIGDLFSTACRVAVTDPVYPVYVDTNVMSGRAGEHQSGRWSRIEYLPVTEANGFVPPLPSRQPDLIYLCYPNNPTGTTLSRSQLKEWVDYAIGNHCIILFDSAYEAYITTPGVPRSIYEIEGAEKVAIEFRSFSKRAGFTGLRCGYTVVPEALQLIDDRGERHSLRKLWLRRQTTKFNGASCISQRAAAAVYTPQGLIETGEQIKGYLHNASVLLEACATAGLQTAGGKDAPYIWVKSPGGISSAQMFRILLERYNIVCTPGNGFGPAGEGYVRLTAFNTPEATARAAMLLAEFRL